MSDHLKPYEPTRTGIHVCGINPTHEAFFTERNFPLPSITASALFTQAKAELETPDGDLVVDLCIGGDILEDFFIYRQSLARLVQIIAKSATA